MKSKKAKHEKKKKGKNDGYQRMGVGRYSTDVF